MGLVVRKRLFLVAAGAVVLGSLGFAAIIQLQPFGGSASTAIDDIGECVAAYVAAVSCVRAAGGATGRRRVGWALMAVSAASWGTGEAVWSVYEVGMKVAVPYPSPADAGFLFAMPPALVAVVLFWREGHGLLSGRRVVLDTMIVFLSLVYTGWVLGLRGVLNSTDSGLTKALDIAYPLGDILIGTALILGIRSATHSQRGRMLLLLSGLACNALADSAFSYLTASGNYTVHGSVLDTGWFTGYLLIALAAGWPWKPPALVAERSTYDLWQVALPWMGVLASGVCAIVLGATGRGLDPFLAVLTGVGGALLTVSVILAQSDSFGALRTIRRSEETLAEVINEAPAGVARLTPELRIMDANPRFFSLIQARSDEAKGALITRYLTAAEGVKFAERMEALSAGEVEAVGGDSEALRGDGTRVWAHWGATAVPTADGRIDYFITMFEDTTARHASEAATAETLELMQRLNVLKTEFLQNVSHEFKTALIGIQGFSEFIRDADQLDVSDARAFAADIYRDAERLDRMVTEMLALDQAENERSTVNFTSVDINSVIVREVMHAEKGGATNIVVTRLAPDLPPVMGDSDRLAEVIRNLLKNAISYSPESGHVTVSTAISDGQVEVSVADQGLGERADIDKRLFSQDDLYANSPIRKVVGAGLGLGIVRRIVELHGGRMWVEAPPEGGKIFHFTLKVDASRTASAKAAVA